MRAALLLWLSACAGTDLPKVGVDTDVADSEADTDAPDTDPAVPARVCNGAAVLCDRRLDQVVFPSTHNSFASLADGFNVVSGNQNVGVVAQLDDGVRGLMLDLHEDGGEVVLCHGSCEELGVSYGRLLAVDTLTDIVTWLSAHPHEVVVLILEVGVEAAPLVSVFEDAGAAAMAHAHPVDTPWATLSALIDADKRLIVLSDRGTGDPAWYHDLWAEGVETNWSYDAFQQPFEDALAQMTGDDACALNRGEAEHPLVVFHHYVTVTAGWADYAAVVNEEGLFLERALRCREELGKTLNFPSVDFHDLGALMAVSDALNQLGPP